MGRIAQLGVSVGTVIIMLKRRRKIILKMSYIAAIAIDEDLGNEKMRDLDVIMDWVFGDEVGNSDKDVEES